MIKGNKPAFCNFGLLKTYISLSSFYNIYFNINNIIYIKYIVYIIMKKLYQNIFLYGLYLSYILYFIVLFGLSGYAPQYLDYLRTLLKLYISLVLIVLYNPLFYKERKFEQFDRNIVFSCAIFLLLSTSLTQGMDEYIMYKSKDFLQSGVQLIK